MSETGTTRRELQAAEMASRLQSVWLGRATLASLGEGGATLDAAWRAMTDRVLTRKLDCCVSETYDGARVDGLNSSVASKYLSDDPSAAFMVPALARQSAFEAFAHGGEGAEGYGLFDFGEFEGLVLEDDEPLTAEVAEAVATSRRSASLFARTPGRARDGRATPGRAATKSIQPYPARLGRAGATLRPHSRLVTQAARAAVGRDAESFGSNAGSGGPRAPQAWPARPSALGAAPFLATRTGGRAQRFAEALSQQEQVGLGAAITPRLMNLDSVIDEVAYAAELAQAPRRTIDAVTETAPPQRRSARPSLFQTGLSAAAAARAPGAAPVTNEVTGPTGRGSSALAPGSSALAPGSLALAPGGAAGALGRAAAVPGAHTLDHLAPSAASFDRAGSRHIGTQRLDGLVVHARRTPALAAALNTAEGTQRRESGRQALLLSGRAHGRAQAANASTGSTGYERLMYDAVDHQWLALQADHATKPAPSGERAATTPRRPAQRSMFDATRADATVAAAPQAHGKARALGAAEAQIRLMAAALPRLSPSSAAAARAHVPESSVAPRALRGGEQSAAASPTRSGGAEPARGSASRAFAARSAAPVAAPVAELSGLSVEQLTLDLIRARQLHPAPQAQRTLNALVPAAAANERRQTAALARALRGPEPTLSGRTSATGTRPEAGGNLNVGGPLVADTGFTTAARFAAGTQLDTGARPLGASSHYARHLGLDHALGEGVDARLLGPSHAVFTAALAGGAGVTSTSPELFASHHLEAVAPRLSGFFSAHDPVTRAGDVRVDFGAYAAGFDDPVVYVELPQGAHSQSIDAALGHGSPSPRRRTSAFGAPVGRPAMSATVQSALDSVSMPLSSAVAVTQRMTAAARMAAAERTTAAERMTAGERATDAERMNAAQRAGSAAALFASESSAVGGITQARAALPRGRGRRPTATSAFDATFNPEAIALSLAASGQTLGGAITGDAPGALSSGALTAALAAASRAGLGDGQADDAAHTLAPRHYELSSDLDAAFLRLESTSVAAIAGTHSEVRGDRLVRSAPANARAAQEAAVRAKRAPGRDALSPGAGAATEHTHVQPGAVRAVRVGEPQAARMGLTHPASAVTHTAARNSAGLRASLAASDARYGLLPSLARERVAAVERALETFGRRAGHGTRAGRLAAALTEAAPSARTAVAAQLTSMGFDLPELLRTLHAPGTQPPEALSRVERAVAALGGAKAAARLEATATTDAYFGSTGPVRLSTQTPTGRLAALLRADAPPAESRAVALEMGEILRLESSGIGGSAARAAESAVLATRLAGRSATRGPASKDGAAALSLQLPSVGGLLKDGLIGTSSASLSERVAGASAPWAQRTAPTGGAAFDRGPVGELAASEAGNAAGRGVPSGAGTSRLAHLAPEMASLALRPRRAGTTEAQRPSRSARHDDGSRSFRTSGSQASRNLLARLSGGRPLSSAIPGGLELSARVVDRANGAFANLDAGIVEFLAHTASRLGSEGRDLRPGFDEWPAETLDMLQQSGWGQGAAGAEPAGVGRAENKVRRLERRVDAARTAWARVQTSRARGSQAQGVDAINWEMVRPPTTREAPASIDLGRLANTMSRPTAAPAMEMSYIAPVVKTVAAQAQLHEKNSSTGATPAAQNNQQGAPAANAPAAKVDYEALARQVLMRLNRRWSFERDRRGG